MREARAPSVGSVRRPASALITRCLSAQRSASVWATGVVRHLGGGRSATTRHVVTVGQVLRWTESAAVSPAERLKGERVSYAQKPRGIKCATFGELRQVNRDPVLNHARRTGSTSSVADVWLTFGSGQRLPAVVESR